MYESETNEIERRWKQGSQTFYPKAIEILLARIHWLEEAAQQSVQADANYCECKMKWEVFETSRGKICSGCNRLRR